MKLKYYLFLLFFFFSFGKFIEAQNINFEEAQIIDEKIISSRFGKKVGFFIDKTNQMSLENIKKQTFQPIIIGNKNNLRTLSPDTTYWFRWTIESNLKYDTDKILILGNVSTFDVFAEYENDTTVIKKSGANLPASMRDIRMVSFGVKLFLPKNKKIKIWIKARNDDYARPITFRFYDLEKNILSLHNYVVQESFLQGGLWMIFLFNLIVLIISKDKTYLYYLAYIFVSNTLVLMTAIPYEFYLGEFLPYLSYFYLGLLGNIAIWYMMFVRHFTRSYLAAPAFDKVLLRYVKIRIIWILFILFAFGIKILNYETCSILVSITVIIDIMLGVFTATRKTKQISNKVSIFLSVGSFCLFIGGGLATLAPLLNIDSTIAIFGWNLSYFEIGLFFQILIFSIGLSIRSREIEKEKETAKLQFINELEKNEKLVKEQNEILEQKVKERTYELQEANEEVSQTNEKLSVTLQTVELQRDDIVASINYAKRIQTALLPDISQLNNILPQSLILYLPKDIVSGDFYWFDAINKDEFIFVIGDCTGHGVPGALMTVVGINLLEQIINVDKIISPAQILTSLDERLLKTLRQQGIETEKVNDGMDVCIFKIDLKNNQLIFAGAKRPLWVLEKENNQLSEYKGDKFPIGSSQFKEKIFTEKEINLTKNDIIYAFTDGYADQFGENGKMTIRRMRDILIENKDKDFIAQKQVFNDYLNDWKGSENQTDDILLLGLQI
ncbi:MAG: hypothetical protein EAZ44_10940 [Cytophagia bacterium]|nr:MAG: hypothetical protein EAZ44_10940 [Cytophagia bacterium]TAG40350.1 MAG: hypothetical protein EAZ31_08485 [Cytophagia bacterium]